MKNNKMKNKGGRSGPYRSAIAGPLSFSQFEEAEFFIRYPSERENSWDRNVNIKGVTIHL
jgi:hypothetical protein